MYAAGYGITKTYITRNGIKRARFYLYINYQCVAASFERAELVQLAREKYNLKTR